MLVDVAEWRQDILEEHQSELEPLWERRLRAPRNAAADGIGLRRCDARIDANTDALALADEAAWPLAERALGSGQPALAAAAALVLATTASPSAEAALREAFAAATEDTRGPMRLALEYRASPTLLAGLGALATAPAPVAASVWAIAALRGNGHRPELRERFMLDASAEARRCMWQVEGRLGGSAADGARGRGPARADYERAFTDPDGEVRRLAIEAAGRTGQAWLLERLRATAAAPSLATLDEHVLLAVLATPAEQALVVELGQREALGWARFNLLALLGNAAAAETLLAIMERGAPVDAALAALAFHRITGVDASGPERIPLLPPGAEPDEAADDILVCDLPRAKDAWQACKGQLAQGRWCYGINADTLAPTAIPLTFDLETRWALQLRAAHRRPSAKVALDVESFPFR